MKEISPTSPTVAPKPLIKVLVSIDFDAVAGHLGTGQTPSTNLADYSSGYFAANVGVPRLLRLFRRLGISEKVTWFVPGHSMESFPEAWRAIVGSGAEVGLHGYAHEGAYQMTPDQERDVLEKCMSLFTSATGTEPRGYRAPLYQLRETTVSLLEEHGFLYDSSLTHHDSAPYLLPSPVALISAPDFSPSTPASSWMHPLPPWTTSPTSLVEIPGNWHMEDMTPLQHLPHVPNAHGYVDVKVVEQMWKARFEFLAEEIARGAESEADAGGFGQVDREWVVFPLIIHPDTSGMAHIIGMIERFLIWLKGMQGEVVEFATMGDVAEGWKKARVKKTIAPHEESD